MNSKKTGKREGFTVMFKRLTQMKRMDDVYVPLVLVVLMLVVVAMRVYENEDPKFFIAGAVLFSIWALVGWRATKEK